MNTSDVASLLSIVHPLLIITYTASGVRRGEALYWTLADLDNHLDI